MDMSQVSDADLQHIAAGDMSKVSTVALQLLADGPQPAIKPIVDDEPLNTQLSVPTGFDDQGVIRENVPLKAKAGAKHSLLSDILPSRKTLADFARPTLEGVSMGLGGAAGIFAAPETLGLSVPAGAALGYAGGKGIADLIEGVPAKENPLQQFASTGKDILTGAEREAFGMGVGKFVLEPSIKIASKLYRAAHIYQAARTKAAQLWAEAHPVTDPVSAATSTETRAVMDRIKAPADLTPGQTTNSVRQRLFDQGVATIDNGVADMLEHNDALIRGAATDNLTQTLGSGADMPTTETAWDIGATQRTNLRDAIKASKQFVSEAYRAVPDYTMPTDSFTTTVQVLKGEFLHPAAQEALDTALSLFKSKPPTTKSLIAFDQYLGEEIRQASKQGNDRVSKVLGILKRGTEDGTLQGLKGDFTTMGEAAQRGDIALHNGAVVVPSTIQAELNAVVRQPEREAAEDVAATYGAAHAKALTHFQKYGTDTIKNVARYGGNGIKMEAIPDRLFTQSGARELVNAKGQAAAAEMSKQHVTNLILTKAIQPNGALDLQRAAAVIRAHKASLDTLGLYDHAVGIVKDQIPNTIKMHLATLGVDAMGNPAMGAREAAKWVERNKPVMMQAYGGSSKEILAMQDYAKTMGILARRKNVTAAGGSSTKDKEAIENLFKNAEKGTFGARLWDNLATTLAGAGIGLMTGGSIGALEGGALGRLAKEGVNVAKQYQTDVAKGLLKDAITNGETAKLLMDIAKKSKVKPADVHRAVKALSGYLLYPQ